MQPIGPLMWEHRLIERAVELILNETERLEQGGAPDTRFRDDMVGFFRTYADALHHGKEEDILFARLKEKDLNEEHRQMLMELIEDHKHGRQIVGELEKTESGKDISHVLERLAAFYPKHINKEDNYFFHPCMNYFSKEEMDEMLAEYDTFEQDFDQHKWERIVQTWEEGRAGT